MLQKLKTLIVSISLLFTFSMPVLLTSTVYADVTQSDINGQLKCGSNGNLNPTVNSGTGAATACTTNGTATDFNTTLKKIINILSVLVGAVAVIMIIVGGFRYVASGGSDTATAAARKTIIYALVGLVIVALAQVVVHFVLNNIAS